MNREELTKRIDFVGEWWKTKLEEFKKLTEALPDDLIEKVRISPFTDDFCIELPYSVEAFTKARRLLGCGWKRQLAWGDALPENAYRCFSYTHPDFPNIEVRLSLNTNKEGSTCHRIKAGEKVVPVYEVVCN